MVLGKVKFLKGGVRNRLVEKVNFEQRFEGSKRMNQECWEGKTVPSRQNSKYKVLEARVSLACSRRSVWLERSK